MEEVFCHIVGLSINMKDKIKVILLDKNFEVIDLDLINEKITKSKVLNDLYLDYQEMSGNAKKSKLKDIKKIETEMTNYWKKEFSNFVSNKINKVKSKKIILLGYNNHFKNERINIKINSKLKFFVKIDILKNAKRTIEKNLDNHRTDIINGSFPLEYLQIDFLTKKRQNLINIYKKLGYELKPIVNILKLIHNNINFNNLEIGDIYVASKIKEDKRIKYDKSRIIGYSIPWLAAVSCIKSKKIKKGFRNNNGFVEQIDKNGFNDINQGCYIYKVDKEHFYRHEKGKNIKFGTTNNIKIIDNYYIENIYKYLTDNGIKLIK